MAPQQLPCSAGSQTINVSRGIHIAESSIQFDDVFARESVSCEIESS